MRYALKCVQKVARAANEQECERRIHSMLSPHPLVCGAHGFSEDSEHLYTRLELLEQGDLSLVIDQLGALPADAARFYAACTSLAVLHLHAHGVVYRDVKPENLVRGPRGYAKLCDFGLSKVVHDERTWSLCGTAEFLAPEIVRRAGYGKAVDMWAVGILLYELLTGTTPFKAATEFEVFSKIMAKPRHVPFPEDLSPAAVDVIKALLIGPPSKRLGCGEQGAASLQAHSYFVGFDFRALLEHRLPPPELPAIVHVGLEECEPAAGGPHFVPCWLPV